MLVCGLKHGFTQFMGLYPMLTKNCFVAVLGRTRPTPVCEWTVTVMKTTRRMMTRTLTECVQAVVPWAQRADLAICQSVVGQLLQTALAHVYKCLENCLAYGQRRSVVGGLSLTGERVQSPCRAAGRESMWVDGCLGGRMLWWNTEGEHAAEAGDFGPGAPTS